MTARTLRLRRCGSWLNKNARPSHTHRIPSFIAERLPLSPTVSTTSIAKWFSGNLLAMKLGNTVGEGASRIFIQPAFAASEA